MALAVACAAAVPPGIGATSAGAQEPGAGVDVPEPGTIVLDEDFDGVPDGGLPDGWTPVEGEWEVIDGELVGVSTASAQLSRIVFGPSLDNYRIDATVRFESRVNAARWAGTILDIAPDGATPWSHAVFRSGSTAANGVEFAVRTAGDTWNVTHATSAPTEAGIGEPVEMSVEVQGRNAHWYWNGERILTSRTLPRSDDGVLGLIVSGARVAFDDLTVTALEPAPLLREDGEAPYAVAHRGYSTIAPENTAFAQEAARLSGARAMELDVMRTADGEHVLWHDTTVDAKSDGTGRIDALTLEELRGLDIGSWFSPVYAGTRIQTWDEALELLQGSGVEIYLELKTGSVQETLQSVIDAGMEDQVVFTSFSESLVAQAQAFAPHIRRGLITSTVHADPVAVAEQYDLSVYVVNGNAVIASPDFIPDLRERGVAITVWTINDASRWRTLTELGIDGMMTDRAAEYVGYAERVVQEVPQAPEPGAPTVRIVAPAEAATYGRHEPLTIATTSRDAEDVTTRFGDEEVAAGERIDLLTQPLGRHVVRATADGPGGSADDEATFDLVATPLGLRALIDAAPDLSHGLRSQLHNLVHQGRWAQLSERASQEAERASDPQWLELIAGDAAALDG